MRRAAFLPKHQTPKIGWSYDQPYNIPARYRDSGRFFTHTHTHTPCKQQGLAPASQPFMFESGLRSLEDDLQPEINYAASAIRQIRRSESNALILNPSIFDVRIHRRKIRMVEHVQHRHVELDVIALGEFDVLVEAEIATVGPVVPADVSRHSTERRTEYLVGEESVANIADLVLRHWSNCRAARRVEGIQRNKRCGRDDADSSRRWIRSKCDLFAALIPGIYTDGVSWRRRIAPERPGEIEEPDYTRSEFVVVRRVEAPG